MGRVSITEIHKGDALTSASVNATIDSWQDESSSIDNLNVRDGSLDRRNFKKKFSVYNEPVIANSVDYDVQIPNNSFSPIPTLWGVFFPITFVDDEQIILRSTFEYDFFNLHDVPSGQRPNTTWEFRFQFFVTITGSVNITTALDCYRGINIKNNHFQYGPVNDKAIHGSSGLTHLFRASDLPPTQRPIGGDTLKFKFAACAFNTNTSSSVLAQVRLTSWNQHMQRFNR